MLPLRVDVATLQAACAYCTAVSPSCAALSLSNDSAHTCTYFAKAEGPCAVVGVDLPAFATTGGRPTRVAGLVTANLDFGFENALRKEEVPANLSQVFSNDLRFARQLCLHAKASTGHPHD